MPGERPECPCWNVDAEKRRFSFSSIALLLVKDRPRRCGPDAEQTQHAARGISCPEAPPATQLPWVHGCETSTEVFVLAISTSRLFCPATCRSLCPALSVSGENFG